MLDVIRADRAGRRFDRLVHDDRGRDERGVGYLDPAVAAPMLSDSRCLIAGVAAPSGRAAAVPGGYRIGGRWSFASGAGLATWLVVGCLLAEGEPQPVLAVLPRADVTVHDTWDAHGLCGTGSHDISADGVFVPAGRVFSLARPPATSHGAFPVLGFLAMGIGAVALGIAGAAIAEFTRLATGKVNPITREPLAAKATARTAVAEATAQHAAGRSFLFGEAGRTWDLARTGQPVPAEQTARLRLAVTHATTAAADAVERLYRAGGGSTPYRSSPLQRHFRDVHVATQHAMVGQDTLEPIGAVLLGQPIGTFRL